MTVHRRYHEFKNALENIEKLRTEFQEIPEIVVVWAAPEIGRLWFFQELLRDKRIQHLVYRDSTPEDNLNRPTTYTASLNIRKGLDFIKSNYPPPFYIICNDSDILPEPGIFNWIDKSMQSESHGLLFFWENGIRNQDTWHTNFFVVTDNQEYWPPVSEINHADVLESQWGNYLVANNLRNFIISHNSRNQKFQHLHISENMEPFGWKPQYYSDGVSLFISGRKSWWKRLLEWLWRN